MTNTDPGAAEYEYEWQNPNRKTFDFGRVLGRSFTGIFANIKPLLIATFIVIAITFVISLISTDMLVEIIGEGTMEEAAVNPEYWIWTMLSSLPGLFFVLWVQLIVVQTSYAEFTNTLQPNNAMQNALKYVLPMFVIAIIYTVVCVIGFYALFVGFVFAWPGWALAGPILIHEKKGVFGSIGQAWNLSKGSKRWIFLLLLILSILGGIVYSVAIGLGAVATGVNAFGGDPMAALNMSVGQQAIYNLVMGSAGYFVYALFASGLTAAYIETKIVKGTVVSVGEVFS